MRTIGGIFGRSAYGPLYEHMLKVQDCLSMLLPMMQAFTMGEWKEVRRMAEEIHNREGEADVIKNEIRRSLSLSIFTSVERGEILLTLKAQDDICDGCEEVARLLEIRRTPAPDELDASFIKLTQQVAKVGTLAVDIVRRLQGWEEGSHSVSDVQAVVDMIDQLQHQEHLSSKLEQSALCSIFEHENKTDAVSLIFLMRIVEQLGEISASAENTADCIERMIGKR